MNHDVYHPSWWKHHHSRLRVSGKAFVKTFNVEVEHNLQTQ